MADADYGYVGAGRGKISLYRRKECVLKNIPEEEAVDRLLELIEDDEKQGKWWYIIKIITQLSQTFALGFAIIFFDINQNIITFAKETKNKLWKNRIYAH